MPQETLRWFKLGPQRLPRHRHCTGAAERLQRGTLADPAGARSEYVPLADNDTAEGRSTNRRIRIVILPKLDQFYEMIEQGMKQASGE